MRIFNSVLAVCAASLIFVQCAKTEGENYDERQQAAFDLWMEVNHDRPEVERLDNGMYIEWLNHGAGSKLTVDDYMYVDYRGYTLTGDIFSNRDSSIAVQQGTFTPYTRYTDHYALYNELARYFTEGEYDALALMREGDSVRLYLPSTLAYRTTASTYFSLGYEGWYNSINNPANTVGGQSQPPSLSGKAVIIDLKVNEVVTDAPAREMTDAVTAANALGYNTQDTIRKGLFFRYVEDTEGDVSGEDMNSAKISEDSTFYFVYALRFLDDCLVATNDPVTAFEEWGDFRDVYNPSYFSKSTALLQGSLGGYISALNELAKSDTMRYNSRMQIVFTSDWAYGKNGDAATATKPVIYPYTPLKMDIITLKYGYDPNAKEEDEEEDDEEE